jgi:hypothetical protein
MKLNLSVADKVIASIPVAPFLAEDDEYLKALRRQLMIRHRQKLKAEQKNASLRLTFSTEIEPGGRSAIRRG